MNLPGEMHNHSGVFQVFVQFFLLLAFTYGHCNLITHGRSLSLIWDLLVLGTKIFYLMEQPMSYKGEDVFCSCWKEFCRFLI